MSKSIWWRVGQQEDFYKLFALIYSAKENLNWSSYDLRRRLVLPLFLDQLVVFFDDNEKILGFLTVAFLNQPAVCHMPTVGILPDDWRSGEDPWVVDLVAPNGGGDRMLLKITRDLQGTVWERVRYFRDKYQAVREVSI